jgi:hypothetical protein
MNARRVLREAHAPDEQAAQQRAWSVVSAAYSAGGALAPARSRRAAALLAPAVALLVVVLALSPAGASVRRWISQALGEPHAAPALFSLPAPGTILASGPHGSWTVAADGSARRLGAWTHAVWSPHALFAAVSGNDQLAAVDRHGTVRWALARPRVRDPSWYSPTGFRVAYLSDHDLRVVAGDGTGDRLLARSVAPVAPAWESGHPYRLAYVSAAGRIVVRDADSARVIWSVAGGGAGATKTLAWSGGGTELLVTGRDGARVYGQDGRLLSRFRAPAPILAASLSPDGRALAILEGTESPNVELYASSGGRARRVLSGEGLQALTWSPDGRWLVVSWPAADQWVFVRVSGGPKILAVSHIRRQLGGAFPRIDGWCC